MSSNKSDSLDTDLIHPCTLQATNHFRPVPKPLALGALRLFRPPALLTVRGHCRNVGTNLRPDARPCPRNSVICSCMLLASQVRWHGWLYELLCKPLP